MNPQQTQPTSPQPTPGAQPQAGNTQNMAQNNTIKQANQAKSNLGMITTMQEHLLKYKGGKNVKDSHSGEDTTPKPEEPQEEEKPDVAKELTDFKKEIEGMITSQIGDLKREIQTALTEDDEKEETQ